VSFSVGQGDIYGLVGRNGAGKTTLFKLIMGLSNPASGSLTIKKAGEKEINLDTARKNIGFMIGLSFFPYLSAYENIEYYRLIKGIASSDETKRVLKAVGLEGVKKAFRTFSAGMKQRLGIAGALLGSPSVIILDEPINGLDPEGIADVRGMINDLNKNRGVTFIISSHVLSELDLIATKFGFIDHGVLLKEIDSNDLHRKTQGSLIIETDTNENAEKAVNILKEKIKAVNFNSFSFNDCLIEDNTVIIDGCFDISNQISRVLIENGIELLGLKRRENTLESYFMNLIGGGKSGD
jgi:ABC-2 type transport system ATP-binding protein